MAQWGQWGQGRSMEREADKAEGKEVDCSGRGTIPNVFSYSAQSCH